LTKKVYYRVPVLVNEKIANGNPWCVTHRQGLFNMTTGSSFFKTAKELVASGAKRHGVEWVDPGGTRWVPLYEAKMIHQYDHRHGDYAFAKIPEGREVRQLPQADLKMLNDPHYEVTPRYWVPLDEVENRLAQRTWTRQWLIGWRDTTSALDKRTVIATVIPRCGVGDKLLLLFPAQTEPALCAALLANLNSIPLDYVARQKLGGTSLKYYVLKQLPVLPPQTYTEGILRYIVPRVLELTYTSYALRPFAQDLGYDGAPFPWDPDRRAVLRAELDALFAYLYGLTRDELRYILDPSDVYGADYPSETFRVLKNNEVRRFGEYRTQRLVLEAWDRLVAEGRIKTS